MQKFYKGWSSNKNLGIVRNFNKVEYVNFLVILEAERVFSLVSLSEAKFFESKFDENNTKQN